MILINPDISRQSPFRVPITGTQPVHISTCPVSRISSSSTRTSSCPPILKAAYSLPARSVMAATFHPNTPSTPPLPNAPSTAIQGEFFTDTVASWIKQGYVTGPFQYPPFPDSRSNSIMATKQKK